MTDNTEGSTSAFAGLDWNVHTHHRPRPNGPLLPEDQRWQKQTIMYDPANPGFGNCTETAIASILGLPLDHVPSFRGGEDGAYGQYMNMLAFLESMGFTPIRLPGNHIPNCLYLASGPSARGCSHVVVMKQGQLVHDPHPSGAGLESISFIYVLVPADPAQALPMPPHPTPED